MAVEEDDRRYRETWSRVSRYWYKEAADKNPHIGRLAHHFTHGLHLHTQPCCHLPI